MSWCTHPPHTGAGGTFSPHLRAQQGKEGGANLLAEVRRLALTRAGGGVQGHCRCSGVGGTGIKTTRRRVDGEGAVVERQWYHGVLLSDRQRLAHDEVDRKNHQCAMRRQGRTQRRWRRGDVGAAHARCDCAQPICETRRQLTRIAQKQHFELQLRQLRGALGCHVGGSIRERTDTQAGATAASVAQPTMVWGGRGG